MEMYAQLYMLHAARYWKHNYVRIPPYCAYNPKPRSKGASSCNIS